MSGPLGVPEIEQLIGAYALDAVDPDEREAVEAHLVVCARCRAELAEHLEAASYLAHTGAPAPEGLWHRIAATLEEEPPAMRLEVVGEPGRPRKRSRRIALAVAAAAAVVFVVLGVLIIQQESRLDDLHHQVAEDSLTRAAMHALSDPASLKMTLASPTGGAVTASAVISPSGTGYLMPSDLPKLPEGRTYQLWGIMPGHVVSLGLLGPDPQLSAFPAHGGVKGLAITDEVSGGVSQPTGSPILATPS
jgi:hypothetical protein